jgi:hypothetical protein
LVAINVRRQLLRRTMEAFARFYDNFISGAAAPSPIQIGF